MKDFSAFAEKLADIAGNIARDAFTKTRNASLKADNSFVTETDNAIERALRDMIEKTYPDHGIFGEEHGRTNTSASHQWVIDPIDGTSAFIAGIPTFTTLIALCINGVPKLGIIDQPILRERWNSAMLSPKTQPLMPTPHLLATTSTDYFTLEQREAFERVRATANATIRHGDAYLYGKLANGDIGVLMDAGLKPYDFCALVPVVEAAGGVITDWQGSPLTLESKGDVIACRNHALHQQILSWVIGHESEQIPHDA